MVRISAYTRYNLQNYKIHTEKRKIVEIRWKQLEIGKNGMKKIQNVDGVYYREEGEYTWHIE